jgi:hypothetical protein
VTVPDNSQFTEDQRAEAYRVESMQLLLRQTTAIEAIRSIMVFWAVMTPDTAYVQVRKVGLSIFG